LNNYSLLSGWSRFRQRCSSFARNQVMLYVESIAALVLLGEKET
jgi:hypothetical protein